MTNHTLSRLFTAMLCQCLAALLLAGSVQAQAPAPATATARPNAISAELVVAGGAAPGAATMLAIHMKPDAGWHGYWLNPGDAGLGMQLDWTVPAGASAGAPQYPVPQTLLISGLMNHVYKGDYAVLVPFTLPADARPGTALPVTLAAHWLACTDEICVPEQATLSASVPVLAAGTASERRDARFDTWTRRLPAPLDAPARFAVTDGAVRLAIPLPESMTLEQPHVFVQGDRIVDYPAPQRFSRRGNELIVELARPRLAPQEPARIEGLLRLNPNGDGLAFAALPGSVPAAGEPIGGMAAAGAGGGATGGTLPWLMLAALAGGLLLNVMPCVFPILSLKALSLARAGESDAQARVEGLAYTAGVVVACVALGAVMLGLRAAGEEVGWAFQLQEPGVVAALLLLAVAITANFLGIFEFAVPGLAGQGAPRGAFATGLLAAFVATPCTGPFMAAAMGAALLLPIGPALALFAALGLGLALPFLAVAFVPALRRRLPRPGGWMVTFRRWMALPMGLTALALLWLAARVGGFGFAMAACALAGALVLLLAVTGRWQRAGKPALRLSALGAGAIVLAGLALLPPLVAAPASASAGLLDARPFSEAALAEARASGKPVFAWFTADWCLTCKVNEQVAIEREETKAAFERAGVTVLRGDWTRRDPEITRYLTAQGAAGVPLYVWYAPGTEAEQLPQVLTPSLLVDKATGD